MGRQKINSQSTAPTRGKNPDLTMCHLPLTKEASLSPLPKGDVGGDDRGILLDVLLVRVYYFYAWLVNQILRSEV
jgi:hypothetical protein